MNTCSELMTSQVGQRVVLVRDRQSKIIGTLAAVTVVDYDHDHPVLTVVTDAGTTRHVAMLEVQRVKFQFNSADPDARPRQETNRR